jgi:hypothetical protein
MGQIIGRRCAVAALALAALGCGTDPNVDFCSDAPTFTNQIRPTIVEEKCIQCHSEGLVGAARNGAPPDFNFDTYESTEPVLREFADAISSGREPPMGLDPPLATTPAERDLVSKWRMCGFER